LAPQRAGKEPETGGSMTVFLGDEKTLKDLMLVRSEIEKDVKRYEAIAKEKREELARINRLIELNIDVINSEKNNDFEWADQRIGWIPKKEF
jgi:hypothetical protein